MANFWQRSLISLGIFGALSGTPSLAAEKVHPENEKDKDRTETTADIPASKQSLINVEDSELRVFYRIYNLRASDMIPGKLDSHYIPRNVCRGEQIDKYYHNAHYDPTMNVIVLNQYKMSDADAYKRGLEDFTNRVNMPKDLQSALNSFNAALLDSRLATPIKSESGKTIKVYNGPTAKTLSDVAHILSQKGQFKQKDEERLNRVAFETGLKSAIRVQGYISDINKENASFKTVGHEFGHYQFQQVIDQMEKEGKFMEDLTPQDRLTLHIADEMTQYIHHDKADKTTSEAITDFRADKQNNYFNYYEEPVLAETIGSATYRQWSKQNMNIAEGAVDSKALIEKSGAFLDEVLERVYDNKEELALVKKELESYQSSPSYKNLSSKWRSFVNSTSTEAVEAAQYSRISPEYLTSLHNTRKSTDKASFIKGGFYNNLTDATSHYLKKTMSNEDNLARVRGKLAQREGASNDALTPNAVQTQTQTNDPNTFVLTQKSFEQLRKTR